MRHHFCNVAEVTVGSMKKARNDGCHVDSMSLSGFNGDSMRMHGDFDWVLMCI